MLRKRIVDARSPDRPPADIHHFNNQIFPSENLVKNRKYIPIMTPDQAPWLMSYVVSIESDVKNSFCEMRDLMTCIFYIFLSAGEVANFPFRGLIGDM